MWVELLQFVLLASVVVTAGIFLARYGDALGARLGMGRTLAGLLLLALATSLPELVTAGSAALLPAPDLAVGNLIGSSLCNLLILGVLDCVHRSEGRILSRKAASAALTAMVAVLLTALAAMAIAAGEPIGFWRVGLGAAALLPAYGFGLYVIHRDRQVGLASAGDAKEADATDSKLTLRRAAIGYAVCAAAILAAGPFLSRSAERVADLTGLGDTFVGSVMLALATSLPELSTTWGAVRLGAFNMAAGSVFGSNAFNMVILLPVDALGSGRLLAEVQAAHAVTALSVIVISAVAVTSILVRIEKRLWGIEWDAVLIIGLALGAFGLLYASG